MKNMHNTIIITINIYKVLDCMALPCHKLDKEKEQHSKNSRNSVENNRLRLIIVIKAKLTRPQRGGLEEDGRAINAASSLTPIHSTVHCLK